LAINVGIIIFVAVVSALLIGAWVYAIVLSKGTADEVGWLRLAFRILIFALALVYLALHLSVLWWLAVASVILLAVFELVSWRRRAPQRAAERQQRQQRRAEVAQILDYYQLSHPADDDATSRSTTRPTGGN